jgi:predicted PhzF superfamily epimerase YddE/YHI9
MDVYIVDAFIIEGKPGSGNPAAVCALGESAFPPDHVLQRVAAEHNLSETAFYRSTGGSFELRWFTPEQEVDLCGHATLAAAYVELVVRRAAGSSRDVVFSSRSGPLAVRLLPPAAGGGGSPALEMDFPSRPPRAVPAPPAALFAALRLDPAAATFVGKARDFLVEVATPAEVRAVRPDFGLLAGVDALCVVVCARGAGGGEGGAPDVVSRVFCPSCGVPEDPVTGSAHCTVVPYFAPLLGKAALVCEQASARGGVLHCELRGDRVALAGRGALFSRGRIEEAALAV